MEAMVRSRGHMLKKCELVIYTDDGFPGIGSKMSGPVKLVVS